MTIGHVVDILSKLPPKEKIWGVDLKLSGSDIGFYDDCFIGLDTEKFVIVEDLVLFLRTKLIGKEVWGYKAGKFYIDADTKLHIGRYKEKMFQVAGVLMTVEKRTEKYILQPGEVVY